MTERLYYDHAYLTEFDAQVLAVKPREDGFDVLLDRSAFYPTSGGQPYDTGTLGAARVKDVQVTDGDVWHTVDRALSVGETVHGIIDWARRFDHMQQHAADHMIAGALHRFMGGVTIGLHIGEDVSTIDVAMPQGAVRISEDDIRRIETDVNEHIQRDDPIRCWFPSDEELATLPLRKKPTVNEHIRVVAIGSDEMVACGGTHPSTAGQIGLVKILSVAPARGKMRVSFVAGMRALKDYRRCFEAAHAAAALLSSHVDQLASSITAIQEKLHASELEGRKLKKEYLLSEMRRMAEQAEPLPDGTRLLAGFVDADAGMLRDLVSEWIEQPGLTVLMGAKNERQATFVFGRSKDGTADMGALLRECTATYGGKGGGKPDFAQGGGNPDMLEAARGKLKTMAP